MIFDLIQFWMSILWICLFLKRVKKLWLLSHNSAHSQMGHYFFSYLLTREVYLIEILEIMAQMWQYVIFLSLKPTKATSVFILNYLKKVVGGATTQIYWKQILKPWYILYGYAPGIPGSASIEKWTKIVSEPAVCQDSQSESLESVKFREKLNLCLVSWWFYKNSHKLTMITRVSPTNCWSASSISSSNRKLVINTIPY